MTQNERIIEHIQRTGSITGKEAFMDFGCQCLPARIKELRNCGYNIITIMENGKNRFGDPTSYARYYFSETFNPGSASN